MSSVIERRTGRKGEATELEDGRYHIVFEDGAEKEIANSTFVRLYTLAEKEPEQITPEDTVDESPSLESSTEETEVPAEEDAQLEELLSDADEVVKEEPVAENVEEKPATTSALEKSLKEEEALEKLNLGIKLLSYWSEGTRGGKTEKIKAQIEIRDYLMEITEYDGYISDVLLFERVDEAPEDDPDAVVKLAYRSPKMSLKDTLNWLGLSEDDAKIARKQITAIRKNVRLEESVKA